MTAVAVMRPSVPGLGIPQRHRKGLDGLGLSQVCLGSIGCRLLRVGHGKLRVMIRGLQQGFSDGRTLDS